MRYASPPGSSQPTLSLALLSGSIVPSLRFATMKPFRSGSRVLSSSSGARFSKISAMPSGRSSRYLASTPSKGSASVSPESSPCSASRCRSWTCWATARLPSADVSSISSTVRRYWCSIISPALSSSRLTKLPPVVVRKPIAVSSTSMQRAAWAGVVTSRRMASWVSGGSGACATFWRSGPRPPASRSSRAKVNARSSRSTAGVSAKCRCSRRSSALAKS
mmetsp:Transcript_29212/g.45679  ORF Transcript_29212/g.45679 Transcript_29212/m.45679 type:complete len:220 (+) Transcript_29212:252-911(+)